MRWAGGQGGRFSAMSECLPLPRLDRLRLTRIDSDTAAVDWCGMQLDTKTQIRSGRLNWKIHRHLIVPSDVEIYQTSVVGASEVLPMHTKALLQLLEIFLPTMTQTVTEWIPGIQGDNSAAMGLDGNME
jgi:hypothetical protein